MKKHDKIFITLSLIFIALMLILAFYFGLISVAQASSDPECPNCNEVATIEINGKTFIVVGKIGKGFRVIQDPETKLYYAKGATDGCIAPLPNYKPENKVLELWPEY